MCFGAAVREGTGRGTASLAPRRGSNKEFVHAETEPVSEQQIELLGPGANGPADVGIKPDRNEMRWTVISHLRSIGGYARGWAGAGHRAPRARIRSPSSASGHSRRFRGYR